MNDQIKVDAEPHDSLCDLSYCCYIDYEVVRNAAMYRICEQGMIRRAFAAIKHRVWNYGFMLLASHNFSHLKCTLTNSEDPEEMPHHVSFHEGPHCLLVPRRSSERS